MGQKQRSRRRLPPAHVCYLCGSLIGADDEWNRDHVPPARLFGRSVRRALNPRLEWLPTHVACNSDYRTDEEYTITCLVPIALTHDWKAEPTPAAWSVVQDIRSASIGGHGSGLIRSHIKKFGTVQGPRKEVLFKADWNRIHRAVWKIMRGLYFQEVGALLPASTEHRVEIFTSMMSRELTEHPVFRPVLRVAPMGTYVKVFDYKWGCFINPQGMRGHAVVMLWWDSVATAVSFFDPTAPSPAPYSPI